LRVFDPEFFANFRLYQRFGRFRFKLVLSKLDLAKAQQFGPIELDALISKFHRGRFLAIRGTMVKHQKLNLHHRNRNLQPRGKISFLKKRVSGYVYYTPRLTWPTFAAPIIALAAFDFGSP